MRVRLDLCTHKKLRRWYFEAAAQNVHMCEALCSDAFVHNSWWQDSSCLYFQSMSSINNINGGVHVHTASALLSPIHACSAHTLSFLFSYVAEYIARLYFSAALYYFQVMLCVVIERRRIKRKSEKFIVHAGLTSWWYLPFFGLVGITSLWYFGYNSVQPVERSLWNYSSLVPFVSLWLAENVQ